MEKLHEIIVHLLPQARLRMNPGEVALTMFVAEEEFFQKSIQPFCRLDLFVNISEHKNPGD